MVQHVSKLFKGIFGHFFARSVAIQLITGLLLLAIIFPFFEYVVNKLAAEEGHTLTNSTLAATKDHLYDGNYGEVVDYCLGIVKGAPNISYIIFSKKNGEEIIADKAGWRIETKTLPYYKMQFVTDKTTQYGANAYKIKEIGERLSEDRIFEYSRPVYIGQVYWGVVTVGFSKQAYLENIHSFYSVVTLFTLIAILIGLYSFYLSSRQIRTQIAQVKQTAQELEAGALSARAPENAIGEIGVLSKAINNMSSSLEEKSYRLKQLVEVVEQSNDMFILFDSELNVIFANDAVQEETQYPINHFMGMSAVDLANLLKLDIKSLLKDIDWATSNQKHTMTRDEQIVIQNQSLLDVEIRLEFIDPSLKERPNYLLVMANIRQRKKMEKKLHQLAYYDNLTGLANRRRFIDLLDGRVMASKQLNETSHTPFALLFLDLDNFKYLNDSLGHEAGDQLLIDVAARLQSIYGERDAVISRLGGDEFTVLIDAEKFKESSLDNLARSLLLAMTGTPFTVAGRDFSVTASVGVAEFPKHGHNRQSLLRSADAAMYTAKRAGKNCYAIFSDQMNAEIVQRMELESEIKQGIEAGDQFHLKYQPIIDSITNQVVAVEALSRWRHPEKGAITPVQFIQVAEESDLIISLSDHLAETVFKQAASWQQAGKTFYVSVNVSVKDFQSTTYIQRIQALVEKTEVDPMLIQLEFTESVMLDSSDEIIAKFRQLKAMGFIIAIDDFGTGYSSLSYINHLPIDAIKVDRSFVSGMLKNQKSNAIVAAVSKLASSLKINMIAEGVETQSQSDQLKSLDCHLVQGWLYSPALAVEELEQQYFENENSEVKL